MRFRAEQHLRRQADIRRVRESGRRFDCGAFTIWWLRREAAAPLTPAGPDVVRPVGSEETSGKSLPASAPGANPAAGAVAHRPRAPRPPAEAFRGPRMAVVASRAAVGGAVERNRAKRRLREVFRHHQHRLPAEVDLLLVARGSLNGLEYREIERKFVRACATLFPATVTDA